MTLNNLVNVFNGFVSQPRTTDTLSDTTTHSTSYFTDICFPNVNQC